MLPKATGARCYAPVVLANREAETGGWLEPSWAAEQDLMSI